MSSKVEEYRRKARECEEQARFMRVPDIQNSLLQLASSWHAMADRLEAAEQQDVTPPVSRRS